MAKEVFGSYSFEVSLTASKPAIRQAIEEFFQVKVDNVRTIVMRGKIRRIGRYQGQRPNWKKAIVTLVQGQKIEKLEAK